MKTSGTNKRIREIVTGIRSGTIVPQPEFQRRLVWSQKHKNAFIRTILDGFPFPEVYFASGEVDLDGGEGNTLIVDGQQRLTTIFEYFNGSDSLNRESDIRPYSALSEVEKSEFLNYDVVVRDLGALSLDDIKQVFLRINSTAYAVNPMEVANARYDGAIKKFGQEIAELRIFEEKNIFTDNDVRRMNDVRLALTIIISLHSGYFNRDEALEEYLSEFNDEFPDAQDIKQRFLDTSEVLENCDLDRRNRVWKKTDFLTAVVEIDRFLQRGLVADIDTLRAIFSLFTEANPQDTIDFVTKDLVDKSGLESSEELQTYLKAAVQASNDRINRYRRGEIFSKMVAPAFA